MGKSLENPEKKRCAEYKLLHTSFFVYFPGGLKISPLEQLAHPIHIGFWQWRRGRLGVINTQIEPGASV
jgi:hypothetical protein